MNRPGFDLPIVKKKIGNLWYYFTRHWWCGDGKCSGHVL